MSLSANQNRRTRYAVLLLHTGGPLDVSWLKIWQFLRLKLNGSRLVDPIPSWLWSPFLHLCVLPWRIRAVQQAQKSMWICHSDPIVDAYAQSSSGDSRRQSSRSEADGNGDGEIVFPEEAGGSPPPVASPLESPSSPPFGGTTSPFFSSVPVPSGVPLNLVSAAAMRSRHHRSAEEPIGVRSSSVVGVAGTGRTVFNGAMGAQNKKHIAAGICKRVARGYSPSVYYTAKLCYRVQQLLELRLKEHQDIAVQVECAFAYQGGSIENALERFNLLGDYSGIFDSEGRPAVVREEHVLLLPLFPQYSAVVTSTIYDIVMQSAFFRKSLKIPHIHFRSSYCGNPHYIVAMERHIRGYFHQHGPPAWLFVVFSSSLKGFLGGDTIYEEECCRTFAYLRRVLGKRRETASDRSCSDAIGVGGPTHSMSDSEYGGTRFPMAASGFPFSGKESSMGYDLSFPSRRMRLIFVPHGSGESGGPTTTTTTSSAEENEKENEGGFFSEHQNVSAHPTTESTQNSVHDSATRQVDPHFPHRVIRSAYDEERVDGISIPRTPGGGALGGLGPCASSMSDSSLFSLPSGKESAKARNVTNVVWRSAISAAPISSNTTSTGKVYVVCPGAVVEDVNTLLTVQNKVIHECEQWWSQVSYIPALNDSQSHTELVLELLAEWVKV